MTLLTLRTFCLLWVQHSVEVSLWWKSRTWQCQTYLTWKHTCPLSFGSLSALLVKRASISSSSDMYNSASSYSMEESSPGGIIMCIDSIWDITTWVGLFNWGHSRELCPPLHMEHVLYLHLWPGLWRVCLKPPWQKIPPMLSFFMSSFFSVRVFYLNCG